MIEMRHWNQKTFNQCMSSRRPEPNGPRQSQHKYKKQDNNQTYSEQRVGREQTPIQKTKKKAEQAAEDICKTNDDNGNKWQK